MITQETFEYFSYKEINHDVNIILLPLFINQFVSE